MDIFCVVFRQELDIRKKILFRIFSVTEMILYYTLKDYITLYEMWVNVRPRNKLYRINTIRNSNLRFSEDLSLGEDWLFDFAYIDASSNDKIAVVGKPLYNYVRGNDKSLNLKYRGDLLEVYLSLLEVVNGIYKSGMYRNNKLKSFSIVDFIYMREY